MSERKTSKEERFLKKLHELAQESGAPGAPIDRYVIADALGLNTKAVDNVVQLLAKNGFVKKSGESLVALTRNGLGFLDG